jgi:hypothetical protein
MTHIPSRLSVAMAGVAMLALAACKEERTVRIDAPEPEPLGFLQASSAELPYAEPAPVAWAEPQQGYRWAERAYGMQQAFYDVPPDYSFDYGDEDPMVWVSDDDWSLYAEPWEDEYRYYYYEPGAAYPYFVRDADYGYGFGPTGLLIAVFDNRGRYLDRDVVYRLAPTAGRYYVRGRDLRNAGVRAQRIPVTYESWAQVRPRVVRSADPWVRAARDDREWRRWRERDDDRELRSFVPEQRRRDTRREAFRQASVTMPDLRAGRDRSVGRRDQAEVRAKGRDEARVARDRGGVEAQRAQEQQQAQAKAERREASASAEKQRQAARAETDRGRNRAQAERQAQFAEARQQSERAEVQRGRDRVQAEHRVRASEQRQQAARAEAQRGREQAEGQRQGRGGGQAPEQARAAEQQARAAAARTQAPQRQDRAPRHQAQPGGGKEKSQGREKHD